jgi:hypothetical protein
MHCKTKAAQNIQPQSKNASEVFGPLPEGINTVWQVGSIQFRHGVPLDKICAEIAPQRPCSALPPDKNN